MIRFIQKLIPSFGLDPDANPDDLHPASRKRRTMTPEQRAFRKKLRARFLRRQHWLIPDAKPPRKRKCKSRKRRKYLGRKHPAVADSPPRILKRQYKPLATELYNLPSGLVDLLRKNRLNLRDPKGLRAAHKIADAIAKQYVPDDLMDDDEVQEMHDAIDKLAENPQPIESQLEAIEKELRERALDLQENHWSDHHREKQNMYPVHPIVLEPVSVEGLDPRLRDVVE